MSLPSMLSSSPKPNQSEPSMHLSHVYSWQFNDIVCAFIKKYNEKSKFCTTTICYVEQVDEDTFAFVRRMENTMSSHPLFERIVVNRKEQSLRGFTFESPTSDVYSENYIYQSQGDKTQYDMFLLKNPGLQRYLRGTLHDWGVKKLIKLMEDEHTEKEKKLSFADQIKQKSIESSQEVR